MLLMSTEYKQHIIPIYQKVVAGSIIVVLRSYLLLMQDYNVAYGAKRALKRMKRTRKKMKGAGRPLLIETLRSIKNAKKVAEKFGL